VKQSKISELKADLGWSNSYPYECRDYHQTELLALAKDNNIETKMVRSREKKCWESWPKGLLKVLWERDGKMRHSSLTRIQKMLPPLEMAK
jgi:hypothetical protein